MSYSVEWHYTEDGKMKHCSETFVTEERARSFYQSVLKRVKGLVRAYLQEVRVVEANP